MSEQSYGHGTSVVNPLEGGNPYFAGTAVVVPGMLPPDDREVTLEMMAAHIGCAPQTVRNHIAAHGIKVRHCFGLTWITTRAIKEACPLGGYEPPTSNARKDAAKKTASKRKPKGS